MDVAPADVGAATPADAAAVAAIYAPYVTGSTASFEAVAPSAEEIGRRMVEAPRLPWLIATREERPVGYCYASRHRSRPAYQWSVECSVYLDDGERGRGTARALYGRLLPELARLGYISAFAGITLPNRPSVAFHEAMGFALVGVFAHAGFKRGAWRDVGWWQRTLREPPAQPDAPRAWEPEAL